MCIEKKFKSRDVSSVARDEIGMIRHLSHSNITTYIDAFIIRGAPPRQPHRASLYMEHCNLGTLGALLGRCKTRPTRPMVEECFVWHVLHSLFKALAYLHFGVADGSVERNHGWRRILHRDIKPDNIFVKTSTTGGMYPNIVLGDFGISIRESAHNSEWGDPNVVAGTLVWQPPEQSHDVWGRADVWAVGAVIKDLCRLDGPPISRPPPLMGLQQWLRFPASRAQCSLGSRYSGTLNELHWPSLTTVCSRRPTSLEFLVELRRCWENARPRTPFHQLPAWMLDIGT